MKKEIKSLYSKTWSDLRVTDLSEFKAQKVDCKIDELKKFFLNNMDIVCYDKDKLIIPRNNELPNIFLGESQSSNGNNIYIYFTDSFKNMKINTDTLLIDNIEVTYEETLDYETFDEYNINSDFVSFNEYQKLEYSLSLKNDCSYIESYSYYVNLKVTFKEDT